MESVDGLGGYLGKWVNSILLWNEYKAGGDRKKISLKRVLVFYLAQLATL